LPAGFEELINGHGNTQVWYVRAITRSFVDHGVECEKPPSLTIEKAAISQLLLSS
jgi:hypothetical protein